MDRRWTMPVAVAALLVGAAPTLAGPAFSCGGSAQLGGAELVCSHIDSAAPPQICTFSWSLSGPGGGPTVVQGTFVLSPGQSNVAVYQGSGFAYALSPPIVLCQGRRTGM